jgi:uncharacterized protein (TIGR02271 family)
MDTTSRYDGAVMDTEATTANRGTTTIAAAFADRERAHDAVHRLHDENFHDSWIGLTRVDNSADYRTADQAGSDTRVESENWFTRFFGEGDISLHEALVQHGVSEADARAVGELPDKSAILTVDGENDPELAAEIVVECGGQLITRGFAGATYGYDKGTTSSQIPAARTAATSLYDEGVVGGTTASPGAGSLPVEPSLDATTTGDIARSRAGMPIDESTRLQLREERLRIDKSRVSRGEATIGVEVVSQTQNVDVPLTREELFIERRPARASTPVDSSPIGTTETVRIPLSEEQVTITKVPIVTEEVVIGKRQVETVQHVSETTRKEQLTTDAIDTPVAGNGFNERG